MTAVKWSVSVVVLVALLLFGVLVGEWSFRYGHAIPVAAARKIAMVYEVRTGGLLIAVPLSLEAREHKWTGVWLETYYAFVGRAEQGTAAATRTKVLHVTVNAVSGTVVSASGFLGETAKHDG